MGWRYWTGLRCGAVGSQEMVALTCVRPARKAAAPAACGVAWRGAAWRGSRACSCRKVLISRGIDSRLLLHLQRGVSPPPCPKQTTRPGPGPGPGGVNGVDSMGCGQGQGPAARHLISCGANGTAVGGRLSNIKRRAMHAAQPNLTLLCLHDPQRRYVPMCAQAQAECCADAVWLRHNFPVRNFTVDVETISSTVRAGKKNYSG